MFENPERQIRALRYGARAVLLIITTFWFGFALLSGAEQYGGGFSGILRNSPNTLPWLVLYLINIVAWKYERIGGALLIACALFMTFAFDVLKGNWGVLWVAVVPLLILGTSFAYCGFRSSNISL